MNTKDYRLPSPIRAGTFLVLATSLIGAPAQAGIALRNVIVELPADAAPRDDIEVTNTGNERLYVVAEPAIIEAPGTPQERRVVSSDPAVTGLLVSPQKLVLEPKESKLVRVALVIPRDEKERVFRITVKPVAGSLEAEQTALKVFVGYDVLLIARPQISTGAVTAVRGPGTITFHNGSNASAELSDGQQCDAAQKTCSALPGWRLYAGADWSVPVVQGQSIEYRILHGAKSTKQVF